MQDEDGLHRLSVHYGFLWFGKPITSKINPMLPVLTHLAGKRQIST